MTLKEIGALAGVSSATVSLVANNKPGVSPAKRQEIQNLLLEHNYVSSKVSASVSVKQLLFLKYIKNGFLVDENTGFVASILDAIEIECRQQGYSLRIEVCRNDLDHSLKNIDYTSLNGVFVLGTELDPSTYPLLNQIPIPYIVIDNRMPHFSCNTITMNNEEMVHTAIEHLASLGFHDIGYFKSSMSIQNFEDRASSFELSCKEFGLTCKPEHIFQLDPYMLGSCACMRRYLENQCDLPPCVFADNDTIAIGAVKALKEYGYKIPRDLCIIGFDDIHFAAINSPSLSTMQVSNSLIGELAVEALHNAMSNPNYKSCKQFVGGTIILRHSTKRN